MAEFDRTGGVQGSREFAAERHDLIRAYQSAREKAVSLPMPTEPGVIAEGVFRSWLEGFLPARYGVTSGYIISAGLPADAPVKHFDVIIYDKMEAPVLWRENNPDRSAQGLHRPIPVEHVLAVLEVKATLTKDSIEQAVAKLHELDILMSGEDSDDEPYPIYLPKRFACGLVFFRVAGGTSGHALNALVDTGLRGFVGGIVLSLKENELGSDAGWIVTLHGTENPYSSERDFASLSPMAEPKTTDSPFSTVSVLFSADAFAFFAFGLLSQLSGRVRPGFIGSIHGLTGRFRSIEAEQAARGGTG